ncbi:MAG: arginine--tRNA ligase, partial [Halobacteriaceae archaeon]
MAMFTWAYETFDENELPDADRPKKDHELVRYYRAGNQFLESADETEVKNAEEEIADIIQGLDKGDNQTIQRVSRVVDEVLDGMKETLDRLPAEFDEFIKETKFLKDQSTEDIVNRLQSSPLSYTENGAWMLNLEEWDIEKPFIFLRSDGSTLYTTRDLAHHEWKFENFDRSITVLGEDQELHARQLRAALDILGNDTDQVIEVFHGWVNMPSGESMSTRKGTGVDLDDLLDEAQHRARAEVEDRLETRTRGELTESEKEDIARQVGVGAVRYDIVAKQPQKEITF